MFDKKFREIGLKIAYYRKRKALKQLEVAESSGISCSYLSKIETGKVRYSLVVLMQIAKALEIDPSTLLMENKNYFNKDYIKEVAGNGRT